LAWVPPGYMCVGEYTNYPEELMLFNSLFKFYAYICVKNQIFKEKMNKDKKVKNQFESLISQSKL
jgi:hypothetical protein